jgi:hypothetical protein
MEAEEAIKAFAEIALIRFWQFALKVLTNLGEEAGQVEQASRGVRDVG